MMTNIFLFTTITQNFHLGDAELQEEPKKCSQMVTF